MVPIKATSNMNMPPTIHTFSPNLLPHPAKFHPSPIPTQSRTLKISCSKDRETLADETLAIELGLQIKKLNSSILQREEALKKSRELLFAEICDFAGLNSEDLRKKWRNMEEEERRVLAKAFVAEWSSRFHPLSARSVEELVQEYLEQSNDSVSGSGNLFPDFRKFLGFSAE